METLQVYKVLDRVYDSKEEAFAYENKIRNNLTLRAKNLKIYYWHILVILGNKQQMLS